MRKSRLQNLSVNARCAAVLTTLAATMLVACSKKDEAPASAAGANAATGRPGGVPNVRGQLVTVTDSLLTVSTRNGDVSVLIDKPLEVYARVPAKLSDVKENSFVGVTSAPQPDGSMKATEIHIFPDKLRGTNEGSFLMGRGGSNAGGGNAAGGNRMTNGTVSSSQMTNGTITSSKMTNGTVAANLGGAITVKFHADSQVINVPSDVPVTAISLTTTKLAPGTTVNILTKKQPDGTLHASTVILPPPTTTTATK